MAKTIMIVDDSATIRMSISATLEMNGFVVIAAEDGKIALSKLSSGVKPDLIITDVNMPNMGGIELIGNVRNLPGFRFTPILTLTTESLAEKRDEGKKAGATGWMVKPVVGADLVRIIKQLIPGA